VPLCPNFSPRGKHCAEHESERNAKRRSLETWRDYGSEWQRTRAAVLAEEPTCIKCGKAATDVDHIVPLKNGGTHARSNLQAMCKRCHSSKTWKENLKRRESTTD
jgi:5-methylcytosine-specific restriction protein A